MRCESIVPRVSAILKNEAILADEGQALSYPTFVYVLTFIYVGINIPYNIGQRPK